mgnify:CR=1 FL=1
MAALKVEVMARQSRSLKDKRTTIRPIVEGARRRFQVAAAEVAHQNSHQLATLGFSAVGGDAGHVAQVLDTVERFVWSFPEIEVLGTQRSWLE